MHERGHRAAAHGEAEEGEGAETGPPRRAEDQVAQGDGHEDRRRDEHRHGRDQLHLQPGGRSAAPQSPPREGQRRDDGRRRGQGREVRRGRPPDERRRLQSHVDPLPVQPAQGVEELIDVALPSLVADRTEVESGQVAKVSREPLPRRNGRAPHEDRDDPVARPQCEADLPPDVIAPLAEAGPACVVPGVEPVGADEDEDEIRLVDGPFQLPREVGARFDGIDVHEDAVRAEGLHQCVVQGVGAIRRIGPSVADEDPRLWLRLWRSSHRAHPLRLLCQPRGGVASASGPRMFLGRCPGLGAPRAFGGHNRGALASSYRREIEPPSRPGGMKR